jgi:hypothetical protein
VTCGDGDTPESCTTGCFPAVLSFPDVLGESPAPTQLGRQLQLVDPEPASSASQPDENREISAWASPSCARPVGAWGWAVLSSAGSVPVLGAAVHAEVEGVELVECAAAVHAKLAERVVEGPLLV